MFLPVPASVAVGVRPAGRALAGGSCWEREMLGAGLPSAGRGVGSTVPELPKAAGRQVLRVRGYPLLCWWLVSGSARGGPAPSGWDVCGMRAWDVQERVRSRGALLWLLALPGGQRQDRAARPRGLPSPCPSRVLLNPLALGVAADVPRGAGCRGGQSTGGAAPVLHPLRCGTTPWHLKAFREF